jgi:hypothetical protein
LGWGSNREFCILSADTFFWTLIAVLKILAMAVFVVNSHARETIEKVRLVGDFYCACIWQAELGMIAVAAPSFS